MLKFLVISVTQHTPQTRTSDTTTHVTLNTAHKRCNIVRFVLFFVGLFWLGLMWKHYVGQFNQSIDNFFHFLWYPSFCHVRLQKTPIRWQFGVQFPAAMKIYTAENHQNLRSNWVSHYYFLFYKSRQLIVHLVCNDTLGKTLYVVSSSA